MLPIVEFRFDFSPLVRAIELALKTTSRGLPKFLGSTAYHIAWKAGKYTPHVPISRMDAELDSRAEFRDGRENRENFTVGEAIVLARMNEGSRYNRLTDGRWAIPFGFGTLAKGYGQLAKNVFRDRLAGYEERQKAGRHSSSHFLQAGWKAVKLALRAMGFRAPAGAGAADAGDDRPANRLSVEKFGAAIQGGQGTSQPWMRIENSVGMEGDGNLAYARNQALHDYSGPALQRAVDEQAMEMRNWNTAKDLEADILAAWRSVPDAKSPEHYASLAVNHNRLGNHLDSEVMAGDAAAPFSR